jgi:NADPH:quinone reductase-like Zn-dependent oxidoreductase
MQIEEPGCAVTIVTSSSDEKQAKAEELAAVRGINYCTSDWAAEVKALTQGHEADHILEVGGISTLPQSFKTVA